MVFFSFFVGAVSSIEYFDNRVRLPGAGYVCTYPCAVRLEWTPIISAVLNYWLLYIEYIYPHPPRCRIWGILSCCASIVCVLVRCWARIMKSDVEVMCIVYSFVLLYYTGLSHLSTSGEEEGRANTMFRVQVCTVQG